MARESIPNGAAVKPHRATLLTSRMVRMDIEKLEDGYRRPFPLIPYRYIVETMIYQ